MATKPRPTLASAQGEDGLEKCKQWISIPTIDPYTGKNITVGENTYDQLQRICAQLGIQLCNNQTTPFMLTDISNMSPDDFIFYNDSNNGFTYCFEPADIDGLLQNPQNPWTRAPLSQEFIQRLNLLKQNIQVPEISLPPTALSINDMRTEVDRVLGLGYNDGSGPDPYVSVGQFLRVLPQNIDILLPNTVDKNDSNAVIRFLYNNRFNKISNKRFIYMIVKYALNKQALTLENIPSDEAESIRSTNESILSLIGSYPGIGVVSYSGIGVNNIDALLDLLGEEEDISPDEAQSTRSTNEAILSLVGVNNIDALLDLLEEDSSLCYDIPDVLLINEGTIRIRSLSIRPRATVTFNSETRAIFSPRLEIVDDEGETQTIELISDGSTYRSNSAIGNEYLEQIVYDGCPFIFLFIDGGNVKSYSGDISTRGQLLSLVKDYIINFDLDDSNELSDGIWNFYGLFIETGILAYSEPPYYKIYLSS